MSKIINVGRVTAYADAVKGGYQGTREEWESDLANLGTTAAEVEADRQEVAANTAAVATDKGIVEGYKDAANLSAQASATSAGAAHTDALAATAAKEAAEAAQGLAESAKGSAVAAKGGAETAQGAAEAAVTQASGYADNASASATAAAGSATDAAASATAAAGSADEAEAVLESIPEDYSTLSNDVTDLKSAITQEQTSYIPCESGTFNDGEGKTKKNNLYRLRNKLPISISDASSITIPTGYQAWIFRLTADMTYINEGPWISGVVTLESYKSEGAKYLNIAIKKTGSESSDISADVDTVANGLILDGVLQSTISLLANNYVIRFCPKWKSGIIDSTTGEDTSGSGVSTIDYIDKSTLGLWEIGSHSGAVYVYRYNYENGVYSYLGRNQRGSNGDATSWIMGLAGTHFRITVWNSKATPNDWMILGVKTNLQDDITNLKKSADKTDVIDGLIGCNVTTFGVQAGLNHSSNLDILPIIIHTGDKFHVVVSGNIISTQIYAKYSDGTDAFLPGGFTYVGVASKEIKGIGAFIPGTSIPADTTVTVKAYLADAMYDKTEKIPDEKQIITTVIGVELPTDIGDFGVSSGYATAAKTAITAWMSDYAGDGKKIPFVVHTDQHGRLTVSKQGLFNLLDWLINWDGVSAIFNLGDTVVDHWEDDDTNTDPLLRNATLEDARVCLQNIPSEKQINVCGNHDTWYTGNQETAVSGVLPSLQYNNPYFTSDGLITRTLDDNSGFKVVYDVKNNVKYLILAGWDYADKPSGSTGYQWYWINKPHLEWIISQMAENDGYDLVLVSHVPLEMGGTGSIDPITSESREAQTPTYITHGTNYLLPLWNARKAKASGSVNYNGDTIAYDFTACKNDCLCALAGHTHYDGVEYLSGNGLLQVAFDYFDQDTLHFGIIDRRNSCIKCWKLSNDSNTPAVNTWTKSFDA